MIYLASPYTDPDPKVMKLRYDLVCEACAGLIKKELTIYSPIAHWHTIAKRFDLSKKYSFWKVHDQEMIFLCGAFWILTLNGWDVSTGVKNETEYAQKKRKFIRHISLEECK